MYCVARGGAQYAEMALGLARSLRLIDDKTPRVIATDITDVPWERYFDQVVYLDYPRSALDKLLAFQHIDAERVLALDVDMLAFRRLDDIFAAGLGRPFVVQGFWETTGTFHRKSVDQILAQYPHLNGAFPRFNGGMIYYERGEGYDRILSACREAEANYDALGFERFRGGKPSEEVCIFDAMMRLRYVEMFPMETQFQHAMAGALNRPTIDILKNDCHAVCHSRDGIHFIRPYLLHTWRYKDYLVYWNQLRALRKLEERAQGRPTEYVTRWGKLRRSIERRIIRNVRKYR